MNKPEWVSNELWESMNRAREACAARDKERAQDERTAYIVNIPAQQLTIYSKLATENTIRTLKSIGVRGSYQPPALKGQ